MGTRKYSVMGKIYGKMLALSAVICVLATGCVNYQSVEDFGAGTSEFAKSYESVFSGSYDTCVSSSEIRTIILELGETPSKSPLSQLSDDQEACAPYKPVTVAFNETTLALSDYSEALSLVATKSELGTFKEVQFIPQFSGVNEDITDTVPELSDQGQQVAAVNRWTNYFQSFYVQKTPREMILETKPQVDATLELLGVFSQVYQVQLDNYERNINVLNTVVYDMESKDVVERAYVINRSKEKDSRQDLLNNYNEALEAVKDSYKRIYERSELSDPHYSDPIFQQDMKEFLIKISNLTQQSKLI